MKKIDEAILILRSIPEEKLDMVIDYLYAFSQTPKKKPDGPADIISFSGKHHSSNEAEDDGQKK